MTKSEKIEKLRNLGLGYVIYSSMTRMPYVECEQESFYDMAFMYESKEDAEKAASALCEKGNIAGVVVLQTVELAAVENEEGEQPDRKLYRNQVREQLMRFPAMGLNAVYFQPAGEEGEVLELDAVFPAEVKQQLDQEKGDLSGLELTAVYFMQYLRREEKDDKQLREYSEEFYANLLRSELLLPAIPEEEHLDDPKLDLMKCKIPSYPLKKADSEETASFLALFTNMDELVLYCREMRGKVRVVKLPFREVIKFTNDPIVGCVIDPLSLKIPVSNETISRLSQIPKESC